MNAELLKVLRQAWLHGIHLQSDFFRNHAHAVAQAASLGYITTEDLDGGFFNKWHITPRGMDKLWLP